MDTPGHGREIEITEAKVGKLYMDYLHAIVASLSKNLPLDNPVLVEGTYLQVNPGGVVQAERPFKDRKPGKGKLYTLIIPFSTVEITLDTITLGLKALVGTGK